MFLALAETLVQIFLLMDDWHKSLLDWCKFDSMVDFELSIKNVTTLLDLICATIVQRHQGGLFHYAFGPSLIELVAARFYASVEVVI